MRGWGARGAVAGFSGAAGGGVGNGGVCLVAARLVDLALHLAFLQEKEYAPYSKWFGTAFTRLAAAPVLGPLADAVLGAQDWAHRERAFNEVGQFLAIQHNALNLTPRLPEEASFFWGRPYRVIHGDRFEAALRQSLAGG